MDATKQMAKMVDAAQPHCDEPISVAMTCSHAGSMSTTLISAALGGAIGPNRSSELPNPVLIAVGTESVFAFDYRPKGFGMKIKKEVARWPRRDLVFETEQTAAMCHFTMTTGSGDVYALEIPTVMGAREVVDLFVAGLTGTGS